jgi:hypothetical protein
MKLPNIETYTFPVILPSTKESISMRPFLVKEEKLLLMAQEGDDAEQQIESIAQIIRNCTFGVIEPKVAPYFDVEYLLLQLRSKSVGEIINPTYRCNMLLPGTDNECGHISTVSINLSEIPATNIDRDPSKFLFKLTNRYTLKLRYPTIYTVNELVMATLQTTIPNSEKTINALIGMFDELIDTETDSMYKFDDYNIAERVEFMDRLTPQDYKNIINFLDDMPSISYKTTYTCERCNTNHEIELEGIGDFLE